MLGSMQRFWRVVVAIIAVFGLVGCGDDGEHQTQAASHVLFSTEGEHLNAYDLDDHDRKQAIVTGGEDEHAGGLSLNGQICFDPTNPHHLLTADDAGQPESSPGWVILQLDGDRVGEYSASRFARLVPTYQQSPDNLGCGFLKDGRALTVDIGSNASGPPTGQLVVWFPPFNVAQPRYCKLDIAIGTAGGVYVDEQERIYVASAREEPGIYRYSGPFPTSDTAAGGCGGHDSTGAAMVEHLAREQFIRADSHATTPNGIVPSGHGTFYVPSVFNGVIAEYDANGVFARVILKPAAGDKPVPYKTGSPLGLRVDRDGTLYYADLGLVVNGLDIGPGRGKGTVRRISFVGGEAQPPVSLDQGLNFPDGLGLLEQR